MGQSKDPTASIARHFGIMTDPRLDRTKLHSLHDILVIAICAVICGADAWTEVASFGNAKKDWFSSFLDLRNGIPSHDTFGRVFAALDPQQFSECFANWLADVARNLTGQVVAIDGKTLRRSYDKASSKQAIHMVSAWAAETRLVLYQLKTEEKSNEITAIPELLKMLALRGCIVTIDAMGWVHWRNGI
jgi:predicted transposase YbfD/YdcC